MKTLKRIPLHIGVIPDGNRRWAVNQGMNKHEGYDHGIDPGFALYQTCRDLGIKEMTFYGFTQDNTKRPRAQTIAFQEACVKAVQKLALQDANLLVVGNTKSPLFPQELIPFTKRTCMGKGGMKVNFLVNYGWNWDISHRVFKKTSLDGDNVFQTFGSSQISRMDLIVRWGGRRRLSGFLPLQSVYADFYVVDDMWPDYRNEHIFEALDWYQQQDVTLGG